MLSSRDKLQYIKILLTNCEDPWSSNPQNSRRNQTKSHICNPSIHWKVKCKTVELLRLSVHHVWQVGVAANNKYSVSNKVEEDNSQDCHLSSTSTSHHMYTQTHTHTTNKNKENWLLWGTWHLWIRWCTWASWWFLCGHEYRWSRK